MRSKLRAQETPSLNLVLQIKLSLLHAVVLDKTAESITEQSFLCMNFIKATWTTMMYETNNFQILLTFYLYKFQCTNSLQIEHLCEVLRNFRPIFSFFLHLNFDF